LLMFQSSQYYEILKPLTKLGMQIAETLQCQKFWIG
jgi:hypothetical protein